MNQPTRQLCQSLRIEVSDLRVGMFVTELDRPWTQTPFMLQGFLLSEPLDLQTLRSLVKELDIDPRRSNPASLLHISWELLHDAALPEPARKPAASAGSNVNPGTKPDTNSGTAANATSNAQAASNKGTRADTGLAPVDTTGSLFARALGWWRARLTGAPSPIPTTALKPAYLQYASPEEEALFQTSRTARRVKAPPPSTAEFSRILQAIYPRDVMFATLNWKERWLNWLELRKQAKSHTRGKNIARRLFGRAVPDYLPQNMKLVVYRDQTTIQEEIGYARTVIEKADRLLSQLTAEIKDDRNISMDEIRPTIQLLTESVIANPGALMWLLRMRSENTNTYARGLKVAVYMMTLGRHLGFAPQQLIELGFIGLLLDIGKLELPDTLWEKQDKLSEQEQDLMQTHVDAGISILNAGDPLAQNVMMGISEHHERLDGSGYPHGLAGGEISLFGRISAIADSFSAMTSERPYDVTRSSFDAMKELFKMAETELHAPLVEEFVQAIGIFPVGSMIELSSGEVAIVLEHNKIRRLEPKVLVLTAQDKNLLEKPNMLDLMRQKKIEGKDHLKILRGLPDGAYGLVYRDFYRAR
ncbi:hypothetical protein BH11PSE12_BH11PSE12_06340 [soil metagenome]